MSTSAGHSSGDPVITRKGSRESTLPVSKIHELPHIDHEIKPADTEWQPKPWGRNKVCCGKVLGPDVQSSLGTLALILIPSGLFMAFSAPFYADEISVALVVVPALIMVATLWNFTMTVFSDPGIVPRRPLKTGFGQSSPPRFQDVVINGFSVRLKYCMTCNIYRPPRTVHCSVCDNCVEKFDHHCPWVGNCVGRRNYRRFFSFVICTATLCLYVCSASVAQIIVQSQQVASDDPTKKGLDAFSHCLGHKSGCGVAFGLSIFTVLALFFPAGLCGYHTYLVMTNQTTYEQIKDLYDTPHDNPFGRGKWGNCIYQWLAPVRRSYIDVATCSVCFPPSESNGNSSKETIELSLPGNDQFIDPLPASQSTTICHESSGVKSIASPALGSETTDTNRV